MLEKLAAIRVINPCQSFNPKRRAPYAVDLTYESGQCVGLLGASVSGNSTLQRSLCGLAWIDGLNSQVQIWGKRLQKSEKLSGGVRPLSTSLDRTLQEHNDLSDIFDCSTHQTHRHLSDWLENLRIVPRDPRSSTAGFDQSHLALGSTVDSNNLGRAR
jgi:ABC-type oligopeptide transport system ATPase subunit